MGYPSMYFLLYISRLIGQNGAIGQNELSLLAMNLEMSQLQNIFLPMTYFVIPLRYTESTNCYIVFFDDRKRYEHELERQMERRVERIRQHKLARFFYFHEEGKVGDCYRCSYFYGRYGV